MIISKKLSFSFIRKIITLLVLYSLEVPSVNAQMNLDTISFIQMSDPHTNFNLSTYNQDFMKRRMHFGKGVFPFVHFFESIPKKTKADFVVITGDMIDFYEAETTVPGEMLGTQIEQFSQLLNDVSNVPVYLTIGNHDITSYPKKGYYQTHSEQARASWIRNAPPFKNGTYYSRVFRVDTVTYRLIFLDNGYFSEDFKSGSREKIQFVIDQYQLDWLDNQLQKSDNDIEIIFMHMPLPYAKETSAGTPNESYDEYCKRTKSYDLSNVLNKKNASVRLLVVGHWHKHEKDISEFRFSEDYHFTQIIAEAFGNDPNNWRLFQLTAHDIVISNPGTTTTQIKIPIR